MLLSYILNHTVSKPGFWSLDHGFFTGSPGKWTDRPRDVWRLSRAENVLAKWSPTVKAVAGEWGCFFWRKRARFNRGYSDFDKKWGRKYQEEGIKPKIHILNSAHGSSPFNRSDSKPIWSCCNSSAVWWSSTVTGRWLHLQHAVCGGDQDWQVGWHQKLSSIWTFLPKAVWWL